MGPAVGDPPGPCHWPGAGNRSAPKCQPFLVTTNGCKAPDNFIVGGHRPSPTAGLSSLRQLQWLLWRPCPLTFPAMINTSDLVTYLFEGHRLLSLRVIASISS